MSEPPRSYKLLEELCRAQDRYAFITQRLARAGIESFNLNQGDARNTVCRFYRDEKPRTRYIKFLAAHYDTVPGAVGANDNLASVAQLLYLAEKLRQQRYQGDLAIAFLDKEELMGQTKEGHGLKDSGGYKLGDLFRKRGINTGLFFVLDVTGYGDTVIISKSTEALLNSRLRVRGIDKEAIHRRVHNIRTLKKHLYSFLDGQGYQHVSLMTPGSDDLSLNLHGIPAVLVSMLPLDEALRAKVNAVESTDDPNYPNTWKSINGPEDTIDKVNAETMQMIERMLEQFCRLTIPFEYIRGKIGDPI